MCEYCNGNEKQLPIQPCTESTVDQAFIELYGVPAICVLADSAWTYLTIKNCPMCGRELGGDAS